jgi:hypothetical protein
MGYLSALGAENLAELADLADMQPVHATRLGVFAEKALRYGTANFYDRPLAQRSFSLLS